MPNNQSSRRHVHTSQDSAPSRGRQSLLANDSVSHERYQKLKRKFREMNLDFERVQTELEKTKKRVRMLKRENDLLLDRLKKDVSDHSITSSGSMSPDDLELSDSDASSIASSRASAAPTANSLSTKKTGRNRSLPKKPASAPANNVVNTVPVGRAPPHKRASKRSMADKVHRVQQVPQAEDGNYILPVQIGILTVLNLGTIVWDRPNFHNDRYIWPVGYTVKRLYNSMVNPDLQTMYTCRIEDGGDGPKFIIEPEDQPSKPIVANTATGAWTTVVREANAIRRREHSNSASGPDYFGFSQATIRKMIQDLPNAHKCKNYQIQEFEIMKTRNGGPRRKGAGNVQNGNGAVNGDSTSLRSHPLDEVNGHSGTSQSPSNTASPDDGDGDGDAIMSDDD